VKDAVHVDHGRKLPVCLRKYDRGNVECDGRPRARTEQERMPCVYRDRCVSLQRLMKIGDHKARDLLKLRKVRDPDGKRRVYAFSIEDSDDFQRWLMRGIDRYGIRNGRVTIRHPEEEKPRKPRVIKNRSEESKKKSADALVKARKHAAKALKEKATDDLDATQKLLRWFLSRLQRATKRPFAKDEKRAKLGHLFIVDRIDSSRYVTVYAKVLKKTKKRVIEIRKPVVLVVLAARSHSLQFRTTLEPAKLTKCIAKSNRSKVGIEAFAEGRFNSKTIPVGKEGASIMAEAIAKAIERGTIKLPKSEKT